MIHNAQKLNIPTIFLILLLPLLCTCSIYSMEKGKEKETEKSSLLSNKQAKHSRYVPQQSTELTPFEALPDEIKEYIEDFLEGNDFGLNNLVQHTHFHPSPSTAQRIEEAFVFYAIRKAQSESHDLKQDNLKDKLKLGSSIILFSNHRLKSLFSNYFEDVNLLDEAIPSYHLSFLDKCTNATASTDELNEKVIKIASKKFSNTTLARWHSLSNNIKESTEYSEFATMRKQILSYFAQRVQAYSKKTRGECKTCKFLPGYIFCACGATNIALGTMLAMFYTLIPGIVYATAIGGGCVALGHPALCCDTPCNSYDYSELFARQPNKEKITTLVNLINRYKDKIN